MNQISSDLDGDVDASRKIEFLEFINGFGRGFDDVNEPLVRALLESFLRLFVRMRRAQNSKALNAGWEWDWSCDPGAGALDGVGDIAGGLVYDAMVKGLQSNTNALSSHTKNNCLLMVLFCRLPKGENGTRN